MGKITSEYLQRVYEEIKMSEANRFKSLKNTKEALRKEKNKNTILKKENEQLKQQLKDTELDLEVAREQLKQAHKDNQLLDEAKYTAQQDDLEYFINEERKKFIKKLEYFKTKINYTIEDTYYEKTDETIRAYVCNKEYLDNKIDEMIEELKVGTTNNYLEIIEGSETIITPEGLDWHISESNHINASKYTVALIDPKETYESHKYKTTLHCDKTLLEAQMKCLVEYYKRRK